jgi:hypothetical protein
MEPFSQTVFDSFPAVTDLTLRHAQDLLRYFADDETQASDRRFEAALLMYGMAHGQTSLIGEEGDLDAFFEFGNGAVVASMLVDSYKKRWPDGECTGTLDEREFMPRIYECACAILQMEEEEVEGSESNPEEQTEE